MMGSGCVALPGSSRLWFTTLVTRCSIHTIAQTGTEAGRTLEQDGERDLRGLGGVTTPPPRSSGKLRREPLDMIRNFAIVAHVDHGKSTLCDRLMEMAGAIPEGAKQYLDRLPVERERGITVKAQSCSIPYDHPATGRRHTLNLIDTPGHVDFSHEVRRSLSAVDGVILLIDATQGIQAQTMATCLAARDLSLPIIPVLNKIDMSHAMVEETTLQLTEALDFDPEEVLQVSAKTGQGVRALLPEIVERLPPPTGRQEAPLRALLVDSTYDNFRGVVSVVVVKDGEIVKGAKIRSALSGDTFEVQEVGVLTPEARGVDALTCGMVGYVVCGIRSLKSAHAGDTLHCAVSDIKPLAGVRPSKPMVWAGIFPADSAEFDALSSAIERLTLNDPSVELMKDSSAAIGAGFRCGFLGVLHLDVFHQRLNQEHGTEVIVTSPSVQFKAVLNDGSEVSVVTPTDLQALSPSEKMAWIEEPIVNASIICGSQHIGKIMQLCSGRRGEQLEHRVLDSGRTFLRYELPLSEIAFNFYDELKSLSSGEASFDYEEAGFEEADLVPLSVLINGQEVDALARIVHRSKAYAHGKEVCRRLKELLPRQLFETRIQASINSRIIASYSISAARKNVLAKCYGGDISRKKKLLAKQKAGKKRMRQLGNLSVDKETIFNILRSG